jgi:hypothetical protein
LINKVTDRFFLKGLARLGYSYLLKQKNSGG